MLVSRTPIKSRTNTRGVEYQHMDQAKQIFKASATQAEAVSVWAVQLALRLVPDEELLSRTSGKK